MRSLKPFDALDNLIKYHEILTTQTFQYGGRQTSTKVGPLMQKGLVPFQFTLQLWELTKATFALLSLQRSLFQHKDK